MKIQSISVQELSKILASDKGGYILVDVRTEAEFEAGNIDGAVNMPLGEISQSKDELSNYNKVFINCRSGARSAIACIRLKKMGLENVINVDGGLLEWEAQGVQTNQSHE